MSAILSLAVSNGSAVTCRAEEEQSFVVTVQIFRTGQAACAPCDDSSLQQNSKYLDTGLRRRGMAGIGKQRHRGSSKQT